MGKRKALGPANDVGVPDEEMHLAALIQNAKAYGLKSTKNAFYRDADGKALGWSFGELPLKSAASCCAVGARMISPTPQTTVYYSVMSGNDGDDGSGIGYTIGQSFYHACKG